LGAARGGHDTARRRGRPGRALLNDMAPPRLRALAARHLRMLRRHGGLPAEIVVALGMRGMRRPGRGAQSCARAARSLDGMAPRHAGACGERAGSRDRADLAQARLRKSAA